MRRSFLVLAVAAVAAVAAPAASAKSKCSDAPSLPGWKSCLTGAFVPLGNGKITLTRVTPTLVIRLGGPCSADLPKRKVVIRNAKGKRLTSARVKGRCHNDVARFRINIRPDLELKSGTVIHSFWSGIPDEHRSPKVKLG